jgi:toxin YoeB
MRSVRYGPDAWEDFLFRLGADRRSRRIDDEHRLVYRADGKEVKILKARYHYGND